MHMLFNLLNLFLLMTMAETTECFENIFIDQLSMNKALIIIQRMLKMKINELGTIMS